MQGPCSTIYKLKVLDQDRRTIPYTLRQAGTSISKIIWEIPMHCIGLASWLFQSIYLRQGISVIASLEVPKWTSGATGLPWPWGSGWGWRLGRPSLSAPSPSPTDSRRLPSTSGMTIPLRLSLTAHGNVCERLL